jgi:hypothetical protein
MAGYVRDDDVDYMFDLIKRICTEVGPGNPGSLQEKARARIMASEFRKSCGRDNVETEEFIFAPDANFGWFRLGCYASALALVLYYTRHLAGLPLLFASIAFLCMLLVNLTAVFEFFLVSEFIDFLFPRKKSQNVIARIRRPGESSEQVKRILYVSGHHDSATAFNWIVYLGFGYYLAQGFIAASIFTLLFGTGAELATLFLYEQSLPWVEQFMFNVTFFILPPGLIGAYFFLGPGKNGGTVPGAADNLSACAVAAAVGRILKRHPEIVPAGTEVRLATFGAEEAGTRGALRHVQKHLRELRTHDAQVCNIDTVIRPTITVFTSDSNGFVRNSREVCGDLARAAAAVDVPRRLRPFPFFGGATDALPFSRYGIKAASLLSMTVPWQMIRWYHTPRDDYTLYEDDGEGGTSGLRNTLKICIEWIRRKSEESAD